MDSFVIANIAHRRTRSFVTVLGVALGVVLVTLTVGLARGQLAERGRREANAGAEILFRPSGAGLNAVSASLSIDLGIVPELESIEGVQSVVPLGQHIERAETGLGWRSIDGVDFDLYARVSGLRIIQGRPFQSPNEAIVDAYYARSPENSIGKTIPFGGTTYTIVGIYEPSSMSRIKIPLAAMQDYFDAKGFASMLLVKVREGVDLETVARALRDRYPDNQIVLTRDLPAFYSKGIPALNTFLNVVIGLSLIISTLVIMLAMYTTVVERTRQIGILKALGASRLFIAGAIEREAIFLSCAGVLLGYLIAIIAAAIIERLTSLQIEFQMSLFAATGAIGVLSGALGALYPAVRAAKLDPVDALAYE
jgi:putative ABC transport system permease protein